MAGPSLARTTYATTGATSSTIATVGDRHWAERAARAKRRGGGGRRAEVSGRVVEYSRDSHACGGLCPHLGLGVSTRELRCDVHKRSQAQQ